MVAAAAKPAVKATKGKKVALKFIVDATVPAKDEIFDVAGFEKFLHDRIKVGGATGKLGDQIAISKADAKVTINSSLALSKRYIKYLTKKYLKKHQLRDFLRVVASDKGTYAIKYFNINQDEEEDAEDDE